MKPTHRGSSARLDAARPFVGYAIVLVVAVADAISGDRLILIGLTLIGPLVAAVTASPRQTRGVAICATVTAFALGVPDDIFLTTDHVVRTLVVASGSAIAVWAARAKAEREDALRHMGRVAEVAQRAILRPPPHRLGRLAITARYVSAADGALVGGDFYETAFTTDGVRVLVGDARGKGLEAVELAAAAMGAFREVALAEPDLLQVVSSIDERIAKTLDAEDFVTCVLVEVPHDRPVARIANCAHHPPLLVRAGAVRPLKEVEEFARPLGLDPDCEIEEFPLRPGDRVLLYTDGLVEARDGRDMELDLADAVASLAGLPLDDAIEGLLHRLHLHVGGRLHDDAALMLLEVVE